MASVCLSQNNYQHFQIINGNMMLLQQAQYKQKIVAQAPTKILGTSNLQNIQTPTSSDDMGPKKKYIYSNVPFGEQLPSVARRNARERNRVKQVNNGFANLRQHLPQSVINVLSNGGRGASKKLSKVDTLRIAVEYIRGLQDMLDDKREPARHIQFDDSSNDGSNFDFPEVRSPHYNPTHLYHSDSSASPTPSYSDSDISIGGSNFLQPVKTEIPSEFKFEALSSYNNLTSDEQPDDEELLDYISSWQEQ